MRLLLRKVLSFLVALVLLYDRRTATVLCYYSAYASQKKLHRFIFFQYLLQTSLYSDKLLAGIYFSKFSITCMFYIFYHIANGEPA